MKRCTRRLRSVLFSSTLLFAVGCGENSDGPGPGPSPVPTSVTLTPPTDLIKIGATERFSAQMSMSDGTTRPALSPVWGSDAVPVALIDAGGTVTGASAGLATIYADAEGMRGTRLLRVVPDYQGSWAGPYLIQNCTDTGAFRGLCEEIEVGEMASISLRLTQTRDTVSGTVALGGLLGDATGTIQTGGQLQVSSSVPFEAEGIKGTIRVTDWNSSLRSAEITGTFRQVLTAQGYSGDVTLSCVLSGVTRTSSTIAPSASTPQSDLVRALVAKLRKRPVS